MRDCAKRTEAVEDEDLMLQRADYKHETLTRNSIAACARSSSISSPTVRVVASRIPRGRAWWPRRSFRPIRRSTPRADDEARLQGDALAGHRLSQCLPVFYRVPQEVRAWSRAHPHHIPIFILVETKQNSSEGPMQLTPAEQLTTSTFDALDAEIRSVFPPGELITPDDVRGHYETLNQAVRARQLAHARRAREARCCF